MITSTKFNIFSYVLLTFLILWSGGGFTYGLFPYWMLYSLPVVGVVFLSRKYRFYSSNWKTLFFLSVVFILQLLKFKGAPISIFSPLLVIMTCMMSAILLRDNFIRIFLNIVYFFALTSLILWVINLIPSGHHIINNIASALPRLGWENLYNMESNTVFNARTLYLFTISDFESNIARNYGPFWEPGRFTIYLTLAMALNLYGNNEKLLSNKNIIFFLTNLTTFSTTGYFAMAIILFAYIVGNHKIGKFSRIVLFVILFGVSLSVWELDFMSEKINEQSTQLDVTYSRFGAIVYHWSQIVESPFIGYGPYLSTTFTDLAISPNGITDLVRYFGIPMSALLYILLFKGVRNLIGIDARLFTFSLYIAILALCFSQTITHSPFFFLLYFFGLHNSQYETNK